MENMFMHSPTKQKAPQNAPVSQAARPTHAGNGKRDVRTLLLCKVNAHHARALFKDEQKVGKGKPGKHPAEPGKTYKDCYRGIYTGPANSHCRRFVTYGSFDAVSIYKTRDTDRDSWLRGVHADNREIAAQISRERSYLPIHLVTYQGGADLFWQQVEAHPERYPVCLTTLIYGVQGLENQNGHCPDVLLTEKINRLLLEDPEASKAGLAFVVYQAISICDAVIFWMTDDMEYVLRKSAQLARSGIARKTFSLLGFDQTVMIQKSNRDASCALYNALQDRGSCYQVRIQGSIRDHEKARDYFLAGERAKIRAWLPAPASISAVCVFGNADFTADIQNIRLQPLLDLAFKMLEHSDEISDACWEIHTEFTLPGNSMSTGLAFDAVSHPIENLFADFLTFYRDHLSQNQRRYPWAVSYLELLATHVNIDHDPVLHAPAPLFLGLASIVNAYIARAGGSSDYATQCQNVLERSNASIQRVIRHWSQLTNQLTQADDLVFHGIGNDPAIYETLPESLLEFYHEYLRILVESIVALGDAPKPGWTGWRYDFDFLLVPDQSQNPRISKMFNLTALHDELLHDPCGGESCGTCQQKAACKRVSAWPEKQVYLVEFQSDLLYEPAAFLFPILHECFHNFGDKFRRRSERMNCLVEILRLEIQMELGLDGDDYQELAQYLRENLKVERPEGLNLTRTEGQIYSNWEALILGEQGETIAQQYEKLKRSLSDPFYLDSAEIYHRWMGIGEGFRGYLSRELWRPLIKKWGYYFKECYADLMALMWLELPLTSYLRLLDRDWAENGTGQPNQESPEVWRYIQRTALVIGAYSFKLRSKGYTKQALDQAWEDKKMDDSFSTLDAGGFVCQWKDRIRDTIYALYVKEDLTNPGELEPPHGKPRYGDHPDQLSWVQKYLYLVKTTFDETVKKEDAGNRIAEIRRDYRLYFRDGKQFTAEFNSSLHAWRTATIKRWTPEKR